MTQKEGMGFTKFVLYSLRVIFTAIAVMVIARLGYYYDHQKIGISLVPIIIYAASLLMLIYALKKNIDKRITLTVIVIMGLVLRIIWCWSIKSIPVSDFGIAFRSANEFLNGEKYIFFDTGYLARFPHMIMFTLYMASIIKVFGIYAMTALKTVNIISSAVMILMMYLLGKEFFDDEKKGLIAAFLTALFPAPILYTAVYSTETIAITFFLASLYYFILVMKEKRDDKYLLLSGILLLFGHLFRMAAQVIIVAYIMYIFIYMRKQYKRKIIRTVYILASFIIPFVIISYSVIGAGVTDQHLWAGKEPALTSMLKGSNMKCGGRWNQDDAVFIGNNIADTKYLKKECKRRIIERYTTARPSDVAYFLGKKVVSQWCQGDFAGAFWSQCRLPAENIRFDVVHKGSVWFQLYYAVIFIMALIGLFKSKEYLNNKIINILNIIFCGYGLLFMIIETQERYGFIISWVFILMAVAAIKPRKEKEIYV